MGTKGGGDRVVGISHQLRSPLLTGQPCPGSMELSTHTAYVLCAVCSKGQRNTHTPWLGSSCRSCVNFTAHLLPTWALGPAVLTQIQVQLCKLPWAMY